LGLIFGLTSWRHLLSGAQFPVQAFVDHANLLHYRHPQTINQRVARYILTLVDYNLEIHHRPGPLNKANALSRQPDYNDGKEDNQNVTPLPSNLFIEALCTTFLSLKKDEPPYVEC
jgi:RNase H-like domain found in reverse transcriptase